MFTGIVSALGEVAAVEPGGVTRLSVRSPYDPAGVEIGASISHAGVCLTVVERTATGGGMRHVVEAAPETLRKSTLGRLKVGDKINLERALKAGDELGGHIVAGHVDGIGVVRAIKADGGSSRLAIAPPEALLPMIAAKGSIAVDGVSLTVTYADSETFGIMVIPHTASVTTIGALREGDVVNLEVDALARYVARALEARES